MKNKVKIAITFGTRPEAIKMAPVVQAFLSDSDFDTRVVLTAQHREMLDQVIQIFQLPFHEDFNIMSPRQSLSGVTQLVLQNFSAFLEKEKPDMVLVHGDTTTTFACSLASYYHQIPVAHVEAGLRSFDNYNPFPEEINRKLADALCAYHFCPTLHSKMNLLKEGIKENSIYITGNTVVDALMYRLKNLSKPVSVVFPYLDLSKKTILMTMHRRESWGQPMKHAATAVREIIAKFPELQLLFPVHRNPVVRDTIEAVFKEMPRVHLVDPLDYDQFILAMQSSYIILSDSGGIQEEAPTLGKPILLTRKVTERPEGIEAGIVQLVGTDPDMIKDRLRELIQDKERYQRISSMKNPFGDGFASKRILNYTRKCFSLPIKTTGQEAEEFIS